MPSDSAALNELLSEIRQCRICADHLPLGPRPVLRAESSARVMIVGQAPGTRVHESGKPWDDASGERLRNWLNLTPERFYDTRNIAIVPMGFCYPGRLPNGGDAPPRPECRENWHPKLLPALKNVKLTLMVGAYAQAYFLGKKATRTVTATVADWRSYAPAQFPLPHPSWRTRHWQTRNPWFETDLLPVLRERIDELLSPAR